MGIIRRPVLGDVVTAFEVTRDAPDSDQEPAELNDETVRYLYDRLMNESAKLSQTIKPDAESEQGS